MKYAIVFLGRGEKAIVKADTDDEKVMKKLCLKLQNAFLNDGFIILSEGITIEKLT